MARDPIPKKEQKAIAKQRIEVLFKQAEIKFPTNKGLANRYVTLARKLSMKVKIKIPLELKRRFCKHCYKYLQPGTNARVRTRDGKIIISCLECKKFMRIPVKNKTKIVP
jgi:ribonuclease P protein subunit RPR2